jgi:hypothetical protein
LIQQNFTRGKGEGAFIVDTLAGIAKPLKVVKKRKMPQEKK